MNLLQKASDLTHKPLSQLSATNPNIQNLTPTPATKPLRSTANTSNINILPTPTIRSDRGAPPRYFPLASLIRSRARDRSLRRKRAEPRSCVGSGSSGPIAIGAVKSRRSRRRGWQVISFFRPDSLHRRLAPGKIRRCLAGGAADFSRLAPPRLSLLLRPAAGGGRAGGGG